MNSENEKNFLNEIEIANEELKIKREEFEHNLKKTSLSWRSPVVFSILLAFLAIVGNIGVVIIQDYIDRNDEEPREIEVIEQKHLLDAVSQSNDDNRLYQLCGLWESDFLQNPNIRQKLAAYLNSGVACDLLDLSETPSAVAMEQNTTNSNGPSLSNMSEIESCNKNAVDVVASCRAYDKSGFHSKPSSSCNIVLNAGDDRFFAQQKVDVISEYYRNLSGKPAAEAFSTVNLQTPEGSIITTFRGKIACANSSGTGRTCESRATVKAVSYPRSCFGVI